MEKSFSSSSLPPANKAEQIRIEDRRNVIVNFLCIVIPKNIVA